jgi:hypothetical protein
MPGCGRRPSTKLMKPHPLEMRHSYRAWAPHPARIRGEGADWAAILLCPLAQCRHGNRTDKASNVIHLGEHATSLIHAAAQRLGDLGALRATYTALRLLFLRRGELSGALPLSM